jgi:hypothetical protein
VRNDEGKKVRADPIIQSRENWRAVVKCAKAYTVNQAPINGGYAGDDPHLGTSFLWTSPCMNIKMTRATKIGFTGNN